MDIAQRHILTIKSTASVEHRSEDDILNEALDRGLRPAPKGNGEHALIEEDDAAIAASQKAAMLELLEVLKGLPTGDLDEHTSEDHDKILYGWERDPC